MTSPTGPLRVAFRADASIEIGTGHVMRCLTLAAALAEDGAECVFLCRRHDGHLLDFIAQQGHRALALPERDHAESAAGDPAHAHWLGAGWQEDAEDSLAALAEQVGRSSVDWLVVDHYALDARWEGMLRPACARLMVIDDIADRPHACDLLLDQNLGRVPQDYDGLVPDQCLRLIGPEYALLRPEFASARAGALAMRAERPPRHVLISMGGVDLPDATSKVLDAMRPASLPTDLRITVVIGRNAPALDRVRSLASQMPWPTEVRIDVSNMAELMAGADLGIGAGGSTTWERCCLGLPGIIIETADNQAGAVAAMIARGAALGTGPLSGATFADRLVAALETAADPAASTDLSRISATLCAGDGARKLSRRMGETPWA